MPKHLKMAVAPALVATLAGCSGAPTEDSVYETLVKQKQSDLSALLSAAPDCAADPAPCAELMQRTEVSKIAAGAEGWLFYMDDYTSGSHQKGLFYSAESPSPKYSTLDKRPNGLSPNKLGYKPLGDNWYIFYQYVN